MILKGFSNLKDSTIPAETGRNTKIKKQYKVSISSSYLSLSRVTSIYPEEARKGWKFSFGYFLA